jgi:hypothetical protein
MQVSTQGRLMTPPAPFRRSLQSKIACDVSHESRFPDIGGLTVSLVVQRRLNGRHEGTNSCLTIREQPGVDGRGHWRSNGSAVRRSSDSLPDGNPPAQSEKGGLGHDSHGLVMQEQ